MFCLSDFKQLNFSDQLPELNTLSYQQPVKFLKLLEEHFDLSYAINKTISTAPIHINIEFTVYNNTENALYWKRRLSYIMDKIELNEIEEKLLQDAYTSYLKNKKWCICHHSYSNEDKQLTKAKVAGLEHLKKIIFIEVDRCVGLTSYNILPDGIEYIQSK